MDLTDLKFFETVSRAGGMNRAAAELNTVQSNVTARIQRLEAQTGAPLFRRHSRGVSLTPAGERLLPFARRAAQLVDDARRAVADDGAPTGRLTVGSLETTAALRLPDLLADYAAAWPEVDLVLRTGTTAEMLHAVLTYEVEAAFVCGPVAHGEIIAETVFREELVAATAPAIADLGALLDAGDVKIAVLRAGCSYRQRLEDILARRGVVGLRLLEFGTIDAIAGCVAAGLGVTLLPRGVVERAQARWPVRAHSLPAEDAWVETQFVRRRDGFESSALRAFLDLARTAESPSLAAE